MLAKSLKETGGTNKKGGGNLSPPLTLQLTSERTIIIKLTHDNQMNQTKPTLPAYMASSVDPSQVSSRVTGAVVAFSSLIIFFGFQFFHVKLTATDVISLATELGTIAGAIWTLKGAIVWIMTKFGTKTPDVVVPVINVDPSTVVAGNTLQS